MGISHLLFAFYRRVPIFYNSLHVFFISRLARICDANLPRCRSRKSPPIMYQMGTYSHGRLIRPTESLQGKFDARSTPDPSKIPLPKRVPPSDPRHIFDTITRGGGSKGAPQMPPVCIQNVLLARVLALRISILGRWPLNHCNRSGVSVPGVRMVDAPAGVLGIEWVEGKSVRRLLPGGAEEEEEEELEQNIESEFAEGGADALREFGISLGAPDSNLLLLPSDNISFRDFNASYRN